MSSSASILPQSSSTTISGGEFNNSAGGQNRVVVNINFDQGTQRNPSNESTLTGSQNPLAPASYSGQGPSVPPLNAGTQSHSSVTLEDHASTEERESPKARYERHLLAAGHGSPLWVPQPHSRLPLPYREKGVSIGDVGIITREGYFDFLFNICLPLGHAGNPDFLPINFSTVHLYPTDISEWLQHDLGSCILTPSTRKQKGLLAFNCDEPEGSILVMPNGAYREDLRQLHKFKRIASQNAENWYKFAMGSCGRDIGNGELKLVTTCDKTNSWGIATYSNFRPGSLTLTANSVQSPVEYTWDYEGRVEVKAGPRLHESLDAAGRQQYPQDTRNQCIFLRSFTVTMADDLWKTMVSTLIQDSSENHISNSRESRSYFPSIISRLFWGSGGRGGSVDVRNHSLGGQQSTTHPAMAINQMLLSQYPNAKVAISHDNDWCAVIREDEATMPDTSELINRIRQLFTSHFDEDGTVYLSQEHAPEANPQQRLPQSPTWAPLPSRSSQIARTMGKRHWTPKANDIIIPIMGPTGAGKSTFINFISGKEVAKVGHDLKSCTTQPFPVVIDPSRNASLPSDRRLVLVDTPGFGCANVDDAEILRLIGKWLKDMYSNQETKLAGIIYLHDISLARISGVRRNLDVFQKLCGNGALRNVILCTTKWSDIYLKDGEMRTEQLHTDYWKEMIRHGSTVHKFEDSSDSAWEVINLITEANREKMEALQIQKELGDAQKIIPDTEAGRQLRYSLGQLLRNLKQASERDSSRREELDAQIAIIRDQIEDMRIPVTLRVRGVLDLGVGKMENLFALTNRISPSAPGINKFLDKSTLDRPSMVPPVGARLGAGVDNLILLLGETRTLNAAVLERLAAKVTAFGSDEVRCWSVKRGDRSQLIIEAPSFDSPGGMPRVFRNVRTWLSNSCREDMQFGIICLQHSRSSTSPSSSATSHASGAMELAKRFTLAPNTLFATFTGEEQTVGEIGEATSQVDYAFNGIVASFRETREHALKMLDIALKKPVELDLLMNGLHAIAGNANAEVLILVMGETGCGKSKFINSAAGVTAIEANGDLMAPSSSIQDASCFHPTSKKHFTLVEMPGFNNENITDSDILAETAKQLKERFNGVKFGGILYLQQKNRPMLPNVLGNDVIQQNLLHVVTIHKPPSGGTGESEQTGAIFPNIRGVAVSEQKRLAWEIIDQVLRKVEPKKLTVGLFHPELRKIARAMGGGRQGVWDWLAAIFNLDLRP